MDAAVQSTCALCVHSAAPLPLVESHGIELSKHGIHIQLITHGSAALLLLRVIAVHLSEETGLRNHRAYVE